MQYPGLQHVVQSDGTCQIPLQWSHSKTITARQRHHCKMQAAWNIANLLASTCPGYKPPTCSLLQIEQRTRAFLHLHICPTAVDVSCCNIQSIETHGSMFTHAVHQSKTARLVLPLAVQQSSTTPQSHCHCCCCYIHGIHQMYMRPRFSWSVASSIRRAAWPSQLRGSEGVDSTPSRVPDKRPCITCNASFACRAKQPTNREEWPQQMKVRYTQLVCGAHSPLLLTFVLSNSSDADDNNVCNALDITCCQGRSSARYVHTPSASAWCMPFQELPSIR